MHGCPFEYPPFIHMYIHTMLITENRAKAQKEENSLRSVYTKHKFCGVGTYNRICEIEAFLFCVLLSLDFVKHSPKFVFRVNAPRESIFYFFPLIATFKELRHTKLDRGFESH
jgi:hypothetical protein